MQKPPWELATVGANFPGRADVVSMLKRWRRVPVLHLRRSGDRSGSGVRWSQAAAARVKSLDVVQRSCVAWLLAGDRLAGF